MKMYVWVPVVLPHLMSQSHQIKATHPPTPTLSQYGDLSPGAAADSLWHHVPPSFLLMANTSPLLSSPSACNHVLQRATRPIVQQNDPKCKQSSDQHQQIHLHLFPLDANHLFYVSIQVLPTWHCVTTGPRSKKAQIISFWHDLKLIFWPFVFYMYTSIGFIVVLSCISFVHFGEYKYQNLKSEYWVHRMKFLTVLPDLKLI